MNATDELQWLDEIDQIVSEFDQHWRQASYTAAAPCIHAYLKRVEHGRREPLFQILLAVEVENRQRRDESKPRDYYQDKYPIEAFLTTRVTLLLQVTFKLRRHIISC